MNTIPGRNRIWILPYLIVFLLLTLCSVGYSQIIPEPEMITVPGGSFMMGDVFGHGRKDETAHKVRVDSFYLAKYEVTQELWQAVMGSNPSECQKSGLCPVSNVSWEDVQVFLAKLNRMTGKHYRLPTEAEWEYAARSGGKNEKWPGTNDPEKLNDFAWQWKQWGIWCREVGRLQPNALGLYDMAGNVYEWCQDWYGADYFSSSPEDNPHGPQKGEGRVIRGGCSFSVDKDVTSVRRESEKPDKGTDYIGFRLALSVSR